MSVIRKIVVAVCASVFLTAGARATPIIERIPVLQPVRIAYVKAASAYRGMNVAWKIAAYTIDEANNAYAPAADTLVGTGDSVQVLLIKYAGKYSYYKIFASHGAERDSIELQVFSKGSMQKYLFRSPWFPSKPIAVWCYLPASFSAAAQEVVVMHGIDRNAYSYGLAWTSYAAASGTLVIAPEFNATDWTSDGYSLGNMFTGSAGTGSLNPREKWTFSLVTDIQRTLARGFGLSDSTYILWGHSAGGQFVHRMMLFAYDPMIRCAIAANPGWYTAPDSTITYPWGVKHPFLSITRQDLLTYVSRNLILMRGTADTVRDSNLNIEPLSDAQGLNRYQRAGYFFKKGSDISPLLRWQLLDVIGSGHDYQKMTNGAVFFLQGVTGVRNEASLKSEAQTIGTYPNPFNSSSTIAFALSEPSHTTVDVYNILGKKIQTLVDEVLPAGMHRKTFDGSGQASGMYLCRISSGRYTSVIKLLLMK